METQSNVLVLLVGALVFGNLAVMLLDTYMRNKGNAGVWERLTAQVEAATNNNQLTTLIETGMKDVIPVAFVKELFTQVQKVTDDRIDTFLNSITNFLEKVTDGLPNDIDFPSKDKATFSDDEDTVEIDATELIRAKLEAQRRAAEESAANPPVA